MEVAYANRLLCPSPCAISNAEEINIHFFNPLLQRGIFLCQRVAKRKQRDSGPFPEREAATGVGRMLLIDRTVGPHQHIRDTDSVFPCIPQKFTSQDACLTFAIGDDIDVVRIHQHTTVIGGSAVSLDPWGRCIQFSQQTGQLALAMGLNRNQIAL